jgi:hypothetical protein
MVSRNEHKVNDTLDTNHYGYYYYYLVLSRSAHR